MLRVVFVVKLGNAAVQNGFCGDGVKAITQAAVRHQIAVGADNAVAMVDKIEHRYLLRRTVFQKGADTVMLHPAEQAAVCPRLIVVDIGQHLLKNHLRADAVSLIAILECLGGSDLCKEVPNYIHPCAVAVRGVIAEFRVIGGNTDIVVEAVHALVLDIPGIAA